VTREDPRAAALMRDTGMGAVQARNHLRALAPGARGARPFPFSPASKGEPNG
jgi:hypothetical protein